MSVEGEKNSWKEDLLHSWCWRKACLFLIHWRSCSRTVPPCENTTAVMVPRSARPVAVQSECWLYSSDLARANKTDRTHLFCAVNTFDRERATSDSWMKHSSKYMWVCKISKTKIHRARAIISNFPSDKRIACPFCTAHQFSRVLNMCINLNTQAVLVETKVPLTYLSTSSSAVSLVMLQKQCLKQALMGILALVKTWHVQRNQSQYRGEPRGHQGWQCFVCFCRVFSASFTHFSLWKSITSPGTLDNLIYSVICH